MKVLTENNIETLDGKSMDVVADNIEKLRGIFPEVFCEDKIDFEKLQEVLGNYIEDKEERYRFEWNGKSQAIRIAQTPSTGTLRPCKEESKNWDTTENLYIEGDNLEVLKLLQRSYQNKIKIIYIDPPYNTGKDFVYKDDFRDNIKNYLNITGQLDDEGNRISTNSDSSGRYHTDWINMMYPRLRLARNLMTDDGVIFISIDDNEIENLKKICNEIFGEENYITEFVIIRAEGGGLAKQVIKGHEYMLVYSRNINKFTPLGRPKDIRGKIIEKDGERYWIQEDWLRKEFGKYGNCHYEEIEVCKGIEKKQEIDLGLKNGQYVLVPKSNGMNIVGKLRNIKDDASKFYTVLKHLSSLGIKDLDELDMKSFFDYPKPVSLIKEIILGATFFTRNNSDIVLDFFSGSSTTAQAVMQLNTEDGGNTKFIMVQLPEKINKENKIYRDKYKNICDVAKERIKRAGEKIILESKDTENIEKLDIGFKVFKLDSSNIKKWNPDYDNLEQSFDDMLENFVPNRTEEDIVYEIMLKYGIDLTYPVEEKIINGKKVFSVGFGALIICLDNDITLDVIEGIVEVKKELSPEVCRVVFKDNGFANDSVKTNAIQILRRNNIKEVMSI